MRSSQKLRTATIPCTFVLAFFLLTTASPSSAQVTQAAPGTRLLATDDLSSDSTSAPSLSDSASPVDPAAQAAGSAASKASGDDGWHIDVSPYLWFPGVHGTVGAAGRELSVHASAGDLLSNFRFGLMGAVELRRKRLLIPLDMMWVRLGDDKPLPLEEGVVTANMKAQEFILTPKIGIRLLDEEKIKIDGLTGFRYWHLGESLNFNPSELGLSFSRSQNWVDPLVGGRIQIALAPKVVINILGDVGGWGVGSQLDYQVVGALGYKIKPTWTLQAGYRYMGVDYRSGGFLFDVIMPGVFFGLTINLK